MTSKTISTRALTAIATSFLVISCGDQPGPETPIEAAMLAFDALKSGDFDDYSPLLVTENDMEEMLSQIPYEARKSMESAAEAEGKSVDDLWMEEFEEMRAAGEGGFDETIEESSKSLDWSSAIFLGLDWGRVKYAKGEGLNYRVDHYFWVKCEDELHTFKMNDVFRTSRGLCTGGPPKYEGSETIKGL